VGHPSPDLRIAIPNLVFPEFCVMKSHSDLDSLDRSLALALNQIRRPSTAQELAERINQNLGQGDRPFSVGEIEHQLQANSDVVPLYWLKARPRK